jgi:high-affinity nickel-transport protein
LAALAGFRSHPLLLGTALLAYTFGLRHAVDADHIAAIDGVTRRLMHDGKRPVGVGLFFALGHSTIVVLLTLGIVFAAGAVQRHIPLLRAGGDVAGTILSALFLLAISAANAGVLIDVMRSGGRGTANGAGFLTRIFRPVLSAVDSSWKMYPVGVLFGLGFDTATEVGLLGIAAIEAGKGLPAGAILIFPLLFTAGMSLLDTTNGVLMLGAYGWAFLRPDRKLLYNVTITSVSIFAALFVGGIEVLALLRDGLRLGASGRFWLFVEAANDRLGTLGFAIIGLFIVCFLVSVCAHLLRRHLQMRRIPFAQELKYEKKFVHCVLGGPPFCMCAVDRKNRSSTATGRDRGENGDIAMAKARMEL